MKQLCVLFVMMGVLLSIGGCDDKKIITNDLDSGDTYHVSGTLNAWFCYPGYQWHNTDCHLFSHETQGDSAIITFVRLNGRSSSLYTDSLSSFDLVLDEGLYTVVIQSRWTLPDTIHSVSIARDTSLHLDVVLYALSPVNLHISFWYKVGDSLGIGWEWGRIQSLNVLSSNKLIVQGGDPPDSLVAKRIAYPVLGTQMYVTWIVPIRSPEYHIRDVYEEISAYTSLFSDNQILIQARPAFYVCLD